MSQTVVICQESTILPTLTEDPEWRCVRCQMPVDISAKDEVGARTIGDTHITPDGRMWIGPAGMDEARYCAGCAAVTAVCRVCGCTDDCACVDDCWWIEPDLCSSCE